MSTGYSTKDHADKLVLLYRGENPEYVSLPETAALMIMAKDTFLCPGILMDCTSNELCVAVLAWENLPGPDRLGLLAELFGPGFDAKRRILWYLEEPGATDLVWLHVLFYWHCEIDRKLPPEVFALANSPYRRVLLALAPFWAELSLAGMDQIARRADSAGATTTEIFVTLCEDNIRQDPHLLMEKVLGVATALC